MSDRLNARHRFVPSRHLGRRVHLWSYGWWGPPVIAFPTASGMAHEWQAGGAVDALRPLIEAGRLKLYCPESNVSESWMRDGHGAERIAKYEAYERFLVNELVPFVHEDCGGSLPITLAGASFGAYYAANLALKYPETFPWALCLSGRYDVQPILGHFSESVYFNAPFAYTPNLNGDALHRVRRHTHLTLVVGLGPFENRCIPETLTFSNILASKGIPHDRDVWGHDAAHQWPWWSRQLVHHLSRRF